MTGGSSGFAERSRTVHRLPGRKVYELSEGNPGRTCGDTRDTGFSARRRQEVELQVRDLQPLVRKPESAAFDEIGGHRPGLEQHILHPDERGPMPGLVQFQTRMTVQFDNNVDPEMFIQVFADPCMSRITSMPRLLR